jgi:exodeoxyribonuclease VII large subunit
VSTLSLFDRPGATDSDDDGREKPRVLRVAEVNRAVRLTLESDYRDVWIEGELSDVSHAASGHVYFTLNDEQDPAQLKGVMFRADARRAKAKLERGAVVRMRGQLTLYEPRGNYQMIARLALPAGAGDLHAELERIRKKLEAEGLFDPARKRRLPRLPRVVGVVTSAHGAAMHDIVRVAAGRCPVRIVVADCRVQGQEAPASIVAALREIQRLPGLDVVIVGRGGGSAEDLWAFNYESVARAIAACRVPTVSAVGHEVDATIADLVADVRASTPSNAAEIVVPDRRALVAELEAFVRRLSRDVETRIGKGRLRLERLARPLGDPRHGLARTRRAFEALTARAARAESRRIARARDELEKLGARLSRHDPRARLSRQLRDHGELEARLRAAIAPAVEGRRKRIALLESRLTRANERSLGARKTELAKLAARLDALSPLAVLSRGYAIALHDRTERALVHAKDAAPGDALRVILHDGELGARVESVRARDGGNEGKSS